MSVITVNVDVGSPKNVRDLVNVEVDFHMAVRKVAGNAIPPKTGAESQATHWQKRELKAEVADESVTSVVRAVTHSARSNGLEVSVDDNGGINCRPQQAVRAASQLAI